MDASVWYGWRLPVVSGVVSSGAGDKYTSPLLPPEDTVHTPGFSSWPCLLFTPEQARTATECLEFKINIYIYFPLQRRLCKEQKKKSAFLQRRFLRMLMRTRASVRWGCCAQYQTLAEEAWVIVGRLLEIQVCRAGDVPSSICLVRRRSF